jgi:two-component system, sensor histidine kinase and response regulator
MTDMKHLKHGTHTSQHPVVPATTIAKWQQMVDLMADIFNVPAGLIMHIHPEEIEVLVSSNSIDNPYEPQESAQLNTGLYCEKVIATRNQLYVPNALSDLAWDKNPDIQLGMICYLGVPIHYPDGTPFGTICVLDTQPRNFSTSYQQLLWQFSSIIEADLRLLTDMYTIQQMTHDLQHAKEVAEAANRAKSLFLATMNHELRTPLNAIFGFTQLMLRNNDLPNEYHNYLETINRNCTYLLTLINDILDMSKIEVGRATLNESTCNLHALIHELRDMFWLRVQEKRLLLAFDIAPHVPQHIHVDEQKLRQVLLNLLSNAIKFTSEGSVTLRADIADCEPNIQHDTMDKSENTARLVFHVEDTGIGIATDDLDYIFEAFAQAQTGKQMQGGTGLGLPISHGFVQLMSGTITVRSELGRGSVFTVEIPVVIIEQPNGNEQRTSLNNQCLLNATTFRILDDDHQQDDGVSFATLTPEMFAEMPTEWVAEVYRAATIGDMSQLLNLVAHVKKTNDPFVSMLQTIIEEFRFDQIVAAIEVMAPGTEVAEPVSMTGILPVLH